MPGNQSFRQHHLDDIEYSNLTILVYVQNDHEIVRGIPPEVFEVSWYLLIILKHVVYLRIILCFTHSWFQPYVWSSHARKMGFHIL